MTHNDLRNVFGRHRLVMLHGSYVSRRRLQTAVQGFAAFHTGKALVPGSPSCKGACRSLCLHVNGRARMK